MGKKRTYSTDEVEILTREKSQAQRFIASLPVRNPHERRQGRGALDPVAQEPEDLTPPGEKPAVNTFLTGIRWAVYTIAAATVFMYIRAVLLSIAQMR